MEKFDLYPPATADDTTIGGYYERIRHGVTLPRSTITLKGSFDDIKTRIEVS
jgi:hypothetical protein